MGFPVIGPARYADGRKFVDLLDGRPVFRNPRRRGAAVNNPRCRWCLRRRPLSYAWRELLAATGATVANRNRLAADRQCKSPADYQAP